MARLKFHEPTPEEIAVAMAAYRAKQYAFSGWPTQRSLKLTICQYATMRLGQDQFRCRGCGIVWDIDEPRPPCQRDGVKQGNTP